MSGMKGAQEAPPFGHPRDGRFGRRLNDAQLTRRTGRGVRPCSSARRSVAQSGAAKRPEKRSVGGADHRVECGMRQRGGLETGWKQGPTENWVCPLLFPIMLRFMSRATTYTTATMGDLRSSMLRQT